MRYSEDSTLWLDVWVSWVYYARSLGYDDYEARKVAEKQMDIQPKTAYTDKTRMKFKLL